MRHFCIGFVERLAAFLLLALLAFSLPRLMPGNPVDIAYSSDVTRELTTGETENFRRLFGLAGNWLEQFLSFLKALVRLDLGYSVQHASPVSTLLWSALPWTLLLVAAAVPIYTAVGIGLGIEAGRSTNGAFDRVATGIMLVLSSMPPFVMATILLIIFGIVIPIFPTSGALPIFPPDAVFDLVISAIRHAVLPALALASHEITRFYFLSRAEAATISRRNFLINAKARGISPFRERIHYYGRNIMPALIARLGDSFTALFGSVTFIEVVFSYPGVGRLLYEAILERDYNLIQGAVLFIASVVLIINWIVDVLTTKLAQRG